MQVTPRNAPVLPDHDHPKFQAAMAAWLGGDRTSPPPQPPQLPPPVFEAVILEEDESWEHPVYGTIQGQTGHYKLWPVGQPEENAVQVHAADFDRQFAKN